MAMFLGGIFLIVFACAGGVVSGQSCKLTLQTDLDPKKEPLILAVQRSQTTHTKKQQLEIAYPETSIKGRGIISVEPGDELFFQCLGNKNVNTATGRRSARAVCEGGSLMIGDKAVSKTSTSCSATYSRSSLRVTQDTCGSAEDTGVIVQLGFKLEDNSWVPIVDACHNIDRGVTLYSHHTLLGPALKGAICSKARKAFSRGSKDIFKHVKPDMLYKKEEQEETFIRILGSSSTYISDKSFLARGHLAPDADFIYNSGQLLTYYYINAAPQWQDFNAGNWLVVENTVRQLAKQTDDTLNVWTGTFGVLELPNTKGVKKQVYLEPTKKLIPVPEILWKLVHNPLTSACTVVVGHNNVFLKEPPTTICTTRLPKGWPTSTFNTLTKGYTYYCDYQGFTKTVKYVPTVACKSLLEFSDAQ